MKDLINKPINDDFFNILPQLNDKSIDLIYCDLPYGTTNCRWDTPIDLPSLWQHYNRIIKDNGAILLYAQTPFDKVLGASNLKMLRYEWIWEKTSATGHLNSKKMPMKAHENILVFYKKLPTYNPQMTHGHVRKVSSAKNRGACIERRNDTDNIYNNEYADKVGDYDSTSRFPRDVLTFATNKQKSTIHKTQKPLALTEYMLKTYSNEGDLVLDNCAGSFVVVEACNNLKRDWICIEKDKTIFDTAIRERKLKLS